MDRIEPRPADEKLDGVPEADDDELITVGEPLWDVVKVEATGPLTLSVEFEDGLKGKVRFEKLHGAFQKLEDPDYFKQVGVAYGAVSWPNEDPDMAPDRMYNELVAGKGEWVVK